MKLLIVLATVVCLSAGCEAQETHTDFSTIDEIMLNLYGVISGPPGERDWDLFRSLFVEGALMGSMRKNQSGEIHYRSFSPEQYIERSGPFLEKGFWEEETHRVVDTFGELAQVFSTYQYRAEEDGPIRAKGINSVQLIFEKERWWIVSIQWNAEREDLPIPEKYSK